MKIESKNLKCHRCGHEWTYNGIGLQQLGKYPVYAQCSKCRTSVKVKDKSREEKNDKKSNEVN